MRHKLSNCISYSLEKETYKIYSDTQQVNDFFCNCYIYSLEEVTFRNHNWTNNKYSCIRYQKYQGNIDYKASLT